MSALVTPYATLSFPNLFTPKAITEGAEAAYSCSLLFSPAAQNSPEFKEMKRAALEAAKAKFGDKDLKSVLFPFRDAAEKADKYQGYEAGILYINCRSKQKPGIVDARNQLVLLPEEVYAGQTVRAQVSPFAWSNTGRKGVSFGLNHIQIVKANAPRIDGRTPANKAFSVVDDDSLDTTDDSDMPF